jgi:hypothetical protein
MDPNLFRIDWEVLTEVLTTIIILSFFIERALSIVFEHRLYIEKLEKKGLKEPIALIVSYLVIQHWSFDALSIIMRADKTSIWGYFITAAVIAGGSKASIKLFVDVMGVKSSAYAKTAATTSPKAKGVS